LIKAQMFRGISTEPDIVKLDENLNAIEHHYLSEEEEIKKAELPNPHGNLGQKR